MTDGPAGLLRAIPDSESTPPLYYVLAWLWTQVVGTGEVGLRSLSALLGTATIVVVWALGRRLGGERAGLAAAALVAFNPMLVWFSQEARGYALLALLGALSALLWLRALERPRDGARALLAWGAVAALALATHYYAIFLIAPQAAWLALRAPGLRASGRRARRARAAGVALARSRSASARTTARASSATARCSPVWRRSPSSFSSATTRRWSRPARRGLGARRRRRASPGSPRCSPARVGGDERLARASTDGGADRRADRSALALPRARRPRRRGLCHHAQRARRAAAHVRAGRRRARRAAAGRAAAARRSRAVAACLAGAIAVVGVARDPQLQRDDWRDGRRLARADHGARG